MAVARWGRAGFSTVDEETLERREDACLGCPYLRDPETLVQKLAGPDGAGRPGARTGSKVCGLCGCTVGRKMRMASESCPAPHPVRVGLTRWGEPAPADA